MHDDDSRRNTDSDKPQPASRPDNPLDSSAGGRREPVFTEFDEDEAYEEADRDTDYASAYEEEAEDDEYLEPLEDENPDDMSTEWQVPGATGAAATAREAGGNPWDVAETAGVPDYDTETDEYDTGAPQYDAELEGKNAEDDSDLYDSGSEPEIFENEDSTAANLDDEWDDEDDYPDDLEELEELGEQSEQGPHSWPVGLVIVGLVALVLLAAGGYGVIQQRSATQEEIRQLQATLATAASPAEVAASREALRDMEQRNAKFEATIDRLSVENLRLSDTVAGLEKQLAAQQAALSGAAAPKPAPAAKPVPAKPAPAKPAPKPAPKPASTAAAGDWFVNFSSYSQRSVAENWAKKLKPSAGKTIVAASSKNGKTFYRVRIVGLTDRTEAQKVAGQLESAYKLPPLWVGSE